MDAVAMTDRLPAAVEDRQPPPFPLSHIAVPSPRRTAAAPASPPPFRRLPNGSFPANHNHSSPSPPSPLPPSSSPSRLEIRLFYVRISPCAIDAVPPSLTLSHLRREMGAALEINGARVPASKTTAVPLRRDRLDREVGEVTYVSTDGVRLTGAIDFEVCDDQGNLILCGSLERMEAPWSNGALGFDNHHPTSTDMDPKTGWSLDCYSAASIGSSAFEQYKIGVSSSSIEVYVAGCFAGVPLILTQTFQLSPRRKASRPGGLDAIPEHEETTEREPASCGSLLRRRASSSSSVEDEDADEYDPDMKVVPSYYPEGWYSDEDGQLSWFNAGVRVGVGIGLGMCVGLGIGVGLLMRSYQATTRNFKRRFF